MKLKRMTHAMMTIGVLNCIAASAPAFAQDAAASIQRVEVTGSSIKRSSLETSASIQTLTRDDIERSGATTALGILTDSVAVDAGINSATIGSGFFSTGASSANMRGLGNAATLVLVNGRRIAPYGLADGGQTNFTNLDAIASEAIERIEILKDGASAIYGSDAIAGVINIILRKNYTGGKIKAGYFTAENFRDLRSRNVSAIYGFGDLEKNGFNTYVTFDAYKRDGYTTGDLRDQFPDWHRATPGRSTWDAPSAYTPTGNYFISSTNIVAAPGCPAANIDPVDKQCKMDILQYDGVSTGNTRYAVASNTRFKIGAGIDANVELTYASANNAYILAPFTVAAPTTSRIWYNINAGQMVGPFFYPRLPVGHPNNPTTKPLEFRARMMDTGDGFNFNSTDSDQFRALINLQGSVGAFDWKSALGHMESSANKAARATSAKGYTDAIVSGSYKFGQQNDAALLETMFPVRTSKGGSSISFFDATVTGQVYDLPAGPLSIALGTDIRRETYQMSSSDNVLNGELVGIFGLQVKDTVNHYALFGEAIIPLLKNVELSAALRADKTSGFEAHLSPKLGLRYNVTPSLLLRGTASGGFRAPNIVESGNGLGRSSVPGNNVDPRRCPTAIALNDLVQNAKSATTSDKALANGLRANDCAASLPSFVSSNPDLKPETSRSYTFGLVFAPIKQLSFALDYYNIERQDQIGTRSVADILKGEADLPAGQLVRVDNRSSDASFIALAKKYVSGTTLNFQDIGKLGLVYNPYVNSGKTRASGIDFDVTSRFKMDAIGDLKIALQGNYDLNFQTFSQADGRWNPSTKGNYDGGARMQAKLTADLKTGAWNNALILNYASGISTNSNDAPTYCVTQKVAPENMALCEHIAAEHTLNWNLSYTGFKHIKLNLYVGNLLESSNPIDWRGGWAPKFRTYNFNATYQF
jgi:iron complex outermembrane receptor protein